MKKLNEKFKSVRIKLFLTLSIVIMVIIALLIVMNSIVLETFYTLSKINQVKNEYYIINNLYNENSVNTEMQLKQEAIKNNFEILIETSDNIVKFSSSESFSITIKQNQELTEHFRFINKEKEKIISLQDNLVIKKIVTNGLDCILLAGELDNG